MQVYILFLNSSRNAGYI